MTASQVNRRSFLAQVGQGMLVAGLGHSTAEHRGLTSLRADDVSPQRLRFPGHDRLVDRLQSTPVERFLPAVVAELRKGTTPQTLFTAAAMANPPASGVSVYVVCLTVLA